MLCVATVPLTSRPAPREPFVLLVDDHEPSLRKLQVLLESVGYHCVSSTIAPDALRFCDGRRPSLVVTDLSMPDLDGLGLTNGLKSRYPDLPVLLITGEDFDAVTQTGLHRTFAGIFKKPLEVEPFLALVGRLLPPQGFHSRLS